MEVVFNLINSKLRHISKVTQVNIILNKDNYKKIRKNLSFSIDNN